MHGANIELSLPRDVLESSGWQYMLAIYVLLKQFEVIDTKVIMLVRADDISCSKQQSTSVTLSFLWLKEAVDMWRPINLLIYRMSSTKAWSIPFSNKLKLGISVCYLPTNHNHTKHIRRTSGYGVPGKRRDCSSWFSGTSFKSASWANHTQDERYVLCGFRLCVRLRG